jgi:hypothetical protein
MGYAVLTVMTSISSLFAVTGCESRILQWCGEILDRAMGGAHCGRAQSPAAEIH